MTITAVTENKKDNIVFLFYSATSHLHNDISCRVMHPQPTQARYVTVVECIMLQDII